MTGLVEVRIRHADDSKSVPFTTWPLAELDAVIQRVKEWGTEDWYGNDVVGQFVVNDVEAFFEVVVGGER